MIEVVEGLQIKNYLLDTQEFFSAEKYWEICHKYVLENGARISTEKALQQRSISESITRDENEKLRNEINLLKRVDEILGWFMINCETECEPNDTYGFFVVINEVPLDAWEVIMRFSVGIRKEVVERLQKRINTKNPEVEVLLKEYLYKRRKTYAERLLEDPRNLAY